MASSITHILVFHVLEQPQFSVGALGMDDGLEGSRQLLHGDLQARLYVIRRAAEKNTMSLALSVTNQEEQTIYAAQRGLCDYSGSTETKDDSSLKGGVFKCANSNSGYWRTYGKIH